MKTLFAALGAVMALSGASVQVLSLDDCLHKAARRRVSRRPFGLCRAVPDAPSRRPSLASPETRYSENVLEVKPRLP